MLFNLSLTYTSPSVLPVEAFLHFGGNWTVSVCVLTNNGRLHWNEPRGCWFESLFSLTSKAEWSYEGRRESMNIMRLLSFCGIFPHYKCCVCRIWLHNIGNVGLALFTVSLSIESILVGIMCESVIVTRRNKSWQTVLCLAAHTVLCSCQKQLLTCRHNCPTCEVMKTCALVLSSVAS